MNKLEENAALTRLYDQTRQNVRELCAHAVDRLDPDAVCHVVPAMWGRHARALASHTKVVAAVYAAAAALIAGVALAGLPLVVTLLAALAAACLTGPATQAVGHELNARRIQVHDPRVIVMLDVVREARKAARSARSPLGSAMALELARLEREMAEAIAPLVRVEQEPSTLSGVFLGGPAWVTVAHFDTPLAALVVRHLEALSVHAQAARAVLDVAGHRHVVVPPEVRRLRGATSRLMALVASAVS